jgi:hypothetical protein
MFFSFSDLLVALGSIPVASSLNPKRRLLEVEGNIERYHQVSEGSTLFNKRHHQMPREDTIRHRKVKSEIDTTGYLKGALYSIKGTTRCREKTPPGIERLNTTGCGRRWERPQESIRENDTAGCH